MCRFVRRDQGDVRRSPRQTERPRPFRTEQRTEVKVIITANIDITASTVLSSL